MVRVLQVVTKMDRGGLETMLMNYYRNIDRDKVQFDFLTHRAEHGQYDDEIEALGGKIYHVPHLNPLNPAYYRALNDFFREHPYKIVHSNLDCTSSFPLRAAKKAGVPYRIAHIHSTSQDKDFKYPVKMISKRLIPRYATDFFACGEAAGKWAFPGQKYTVMRNAIEVEKYLPDLEKRNKIRKEFGLKNELVVGHVGRFVPTKNHTFLLKLLVELKKEEADAKLLLVGDGELKKKIEEKAEQLGIKESVVFTGVRSDVNDLMQAMDVFVLPSLYEGFPLTMVEAQTSGLPCVISDKVPMECAVTNGLVSSAKLSDGVDVWVSEILKTKAIERKSRLDEIVESGFDIKQAAKWLEDYYIKCARRCRRA